MPARRSAARSTLEGLALIAVRIVLGADFVAFLDTLVLELIQGFVVVDVDGDGITRLDVLQGGFGRLSVAGNLQLGYVAYHLDFVSRGDRRDGQGGSSQGDGNKQLSDRFTHLGSPVNDGG